MIALRRAVAAWWTDTRTHRRRATQYLLRSLSDAAKVTTSLHVHYALEIHATLPQRGALCTSARRGPVLSFSTFDHARTSTFDLLNPKPKYFISVPRCTSDKGLKKIHQCIPDRRYRRNNTTDARAHARTDGQMTASPPPNGGEGIKI